MKKIMAFGFLVVMSMVIWGCNVQPPAGEATGRGSRVNDVAFLSYLDLEARYGPGNYYTKTGNDVCKDFQYNACVMSFTLTTFDYYSSTTGICGGAGSTHLFRDSRFEPISCSSGSWGPSTCQRDTAVTGGDVATQGSLQGVVCVK